MKFNGAITALVTPFKNGKIDLNSFEKIMKYQLDRGIQGFVINGTTGESPTLLPEELSALFNRARSLVGKEFPLIMGVGTNSTAQTCQNAKVAEALGADAILVVVPYYNKPPQRGLFQHFMQVAESTQLPVILYNVPGRTITSLEVETIAKLAEHPRIVAIKEASGNIEFAKSILSQCSKSLTLLSGDDESYEAFLKAGGEGIISVASHILPKEFVNKKIRNHLNLIKLLYVEPNPIPVKMALYLLGQIESPECRLPLVTALDSTAEKLKAALKQAGLLS
jgi:4-hydroxy-tetrahydrodipicolinate synthase